MLNILNRISTVLEPLMFNVVAHKKGSDELLDLFDVHSDNNNIETLAEHSKRTVEVFYYLMKEDNFKVLNKILDRFENIERALFLLVLSLYLHDFGKCNPKFQNKIRATSISPDTIFNCSDDKYGVNFNTENYSVLKDEDIINSSNHSACNFLPYLCETFFNEYYSEEEIMFFYNIIKSHHSNLIFSNTLVIDDFMFISELIFNFVIQSDIIATKFFYSEEEDLEKFVYRNIENINILNLENGLEYNREIYKDDNSKLFASDNLNVVKTKLAREAIKRIKNSDKNIHILKAPTGAGKTNLSFIYINEMMKKRKYKKVFFINPLNTLNYQVRDAAKITFDIDNVYILNSETKIEHKYNIEEKNMNIDRFVNFEYPFIVTSHVNFFEKLYSKSKKDKLSLMNLNDSIIIIDEIQLYKDDLAYLNYEYIRLLEKYLNCSILIISATVPPFHKNFDVDFLLTEEYERELYNHNVFKRVKFSFDYFNSKNILEILKKENDNNSFLITCNTLPQCDDLFMKYKDKFIDYKVFFFSSRIIPCLQTKILNEIKLALKQKEKIICISTSKIETGVDISFDVGIRYKTEIHNILQNSGRINRYGLNENSTLYILDDDSFRREGLARAITYYKEDWYKSFFIDEYSVDVLNSYKKMLEFSYSTSEKMNELLFYLQSQTESSFIKLNQLNVIDKDKKVHCYVKDLIVNIPLSNEDKEILNIFNINHSSQIIDKLRVVNTKREFDILLNILEKISFKNWKKVGEKKILENKGYISEFYGVNYNYETFEIS